jgi:hypothetical protein
LAISLVARHGDIGPGRVISHRTGNANRHIAQVDVACISDRGVDHTIEAPYEPPVGFGGRGRRDDGAIDKLVPRCLPRFPGQEFGEAQWLRNFHAALLREVGFAEQRSESAARH